MFATGWNLATFGTGSLKYEITVCLRKQKYFSEELDANHVFHWFIVDRIEETSDQHLLPEWNFATFCMNEITLYLKILKDFSEESEKIFLLKDKNCHWSYTALPFARSVIQNLHDAHQRTSYSVRVLFILFLLDANNILVTKHNLKKVCKHQQFAVSYP